MRRFAEARLSRARKIYLFADLRRTAAICPVVSIICNVRVLAVSKLRDILQPFFKIPAYLTSPGSLVLIAVTIEPWNSDGNILALIFISYRWQRRFWKLRLNGQSIHFL